MVNTTDLGNSALIIITVLGMWLAAFWLALIIWVYRDHRSRSRDGLVSFAAALMTAILFLPGLLIYILLRPRETLSEAYERSLEEEALLQEIEEKSICPGCGRPAKESWQVCPYCHTTLKKPCARCGDMLELTWNQCPSCAAVQPNFSGANQHEQPVNSAQAHKAPNQPEYITDEPYA